MKDIEPDARQLAGQRLEPVVAFLVGYIVKYKEAAGHTGYETENIEDGIPFPVGKVAVSGFQIIAGHEQVVWMCCKSY